MDPIHGSFAHSAVEAIHAPAGITGQGTLRPTPAGLEIDAFASPTNWMSLFGLLGFFIGVAMAMALHGFARKHGLGVYPLGVIVISPMLAGIGLARKMIKSKPLKVTVSWTKIRKPDLQENQLTFVLKQKPKGLVRFYSDHNDALSFVLAAMRNNAGPT